MSKMNRRLDSPEAKLLKLREIIARCDRAMVAFSGGVDSTFLVAVAREVLGDRLLAITAASPLTLPGEVAQTRELAAFLGVRHLVLNTDPLSIDEVAMNTPDRCYACKKMLISRFLEAGRAGGYACLLEGSHSDDPANDRPGMRACREMGVRSPLAEAGFSKMEIRGLSRELKLPTWNKPSLACLASRFPYGEPLTLQKLEMVARAETYLHGRGFTQVRVRHHGLLARIEIPPEEFAGLLKAAADTAAAFKDIGYAQVTLDLQGYRQGGANDAVKQG